MKIETFIARGFLVAALLTTVTSAQAADQVLLFDDFDGYADQAAFQAVWTPAGTQPSATLSTDLSVSSPKSVHVPLAVDNASSQRNERSFTESGIPSSENVITFSFDYYDSNAALAPYRQFANLQDGLTPGAGGQLVAMGLNNNLSSTAEGGNYYMARILGLAGNVGGTAGAFFKLNEIGAPLRSTGWHNLKVVFTDTEFKFYVDNILSKTVANTTTLRSYDVVRLGSGLSATASVNFDNVRVSLPGPTEYSLEIQPLANNEITVSWPEDAADFVLEANADLNSSSWSEVTNVPVVENGKKVVTISTTESATFYRLKKPSL